MRDFKGKAAVVTGAASGIGLGIATALARAGMNVALLDLRPEPLEAARRRIEALGVKAIGITTDISDPASVARAAAVVEQAFPAVHVVVNNAGVAMHGTPIEQVKPEEWNWVIGVNIMGVINGVHTFLPMIRRHGQGGHVVNTASISGFFIREGSNQGAYSMTKYAVVALSEALEQEVRDAGIGVSVLCPGAVRTSIFTSAATRPERFGGAYTRPEQEAMRSTTSSQALDPDVIGERVVRAIQDNEFYIFTHTNERQTIQARHARISAALDHADMVNRP